MPSKIKLKDIYRNRKVFSTYEIKLIASDIQSKITRKVNKQGNMTHNKKENQPIKTNPILTRMLESVDQSAETLTVLHMCTKLDKELKMLKLVMWKKNFKDQDQTSRSENCNVWDEPDTEWD